MVVAPSLEAVPAIGEAVRELCRAEGLSDADASLVELGIVESVNNVVEHGYHGGGEGRIDVRVIADGRGVEASIRDDAPPADAKVFERPAERPLDRNDRTSLPEGGFGLGVIHTVFDEVTYGREGARNLLTLIRRANG